METIAQANPSHRHHWMIEPANGPLSAGACKYCGAHRDFPNWLAETDFMGREERALPAAGSYPSRGSARLSW